MSIIEKAKLFAIKAHNDQKYGELPYSYHLERVYENIDRLYPTRRGDLIEASEEAVFIAAWLHDTLEDTDTTFDQLFQEFGRVVARLVFACTDEPGKNRKERHERTYPKLKAAGRDAIAVKLADRLANIQHSLKHNHGMFQMYQREYPDFKAALHLAGELKEMWAELDVLMATKIEPPKEKKQEQEAKSEVV